ncbi:30S ribosomal protein S11 [Candidatus Saccharibacteria bacterium]|nr:30S ribosomal protein S11 [Candidatus Saccharibacteria bacterium]
MNEEVEKKEVVTAVDQDDTTVEAKTAPKARIKKKAKRSVPLGQAHIQATFNNTLISFSDPHGNVIAASSAGACGFRGSKKGTAYAAQIATDKAAEIAKTQFGLTKVDVFIKGVGLGRDAAIRALSNHEFIIESIADVTGVPHGGVRPKRERRA